MADLLTTFGREIQGVAFLILRNQADAEEIVIDTVVTAWRKSGDLRDDNALRTWLLRIATRQALSRRRRQRPVQWIDLERAAAPSSTDPSLLDRLMLADAMTALPAQTRAAITLHHYAGPQRRGGGEGAGQEPEHREVPVACGPCAASCRAGRSSTHRS